MTAPPRKRGRPRKTPVSPPPQKRRPGRPRKLGRAVYDESMAPSERSARADLVGDSADRYRRAKAELAELQLKERRRDLVPREEVSRLLVARASEFRRELLTSMPRRLAPQLVNRTVLSEIVACIEADARGILERYTRVGDDPLLQGLLQGKLQVLEESERP